jgi:tRNA U34 5-methylaminomethyl-2-thiouridine-forming methyltransferase MnmC
MPDTPHQVDWDETGQPRSVQFGDQFYSREDGRAECAYVFIAGNGLPRRWLGASHFHIAELGFGTGLNCVETWRHWIATRQPGQHLYFTSFEAWPMAADDMARALSRWPDIAVLSENFITRWRQCGPEARIELDSQTTLKVESGQAFANVASWNESADAWFLDGFSPARNPDMWSPDLMQAVFDHTSPGGTFATYAAAGWVRRNLAAAGFSVERKSGFGSKREMLTGVRDSTPSFTDSC